MTHAHVGGEDGIICVTNSVVTSPSAMREASCELPVEYSDTGATCTVSSCFPLALALARGAKQLATIVAATRHIVARLSTEVNIGAGRAELRREFLRGLQGIR